MSYARKTPVPKNSFTLSNSVQLQLSLNQLCTVFPLFNSFSFSAPAGYIGFGFLRTILNLSSDNFLSSRQTVSQLTSVMPRRFYRPSVGNANEIQRGADRGW